MWCLGKVVEPAEWKVHYDMLKKDCLFAIGIQWVQCLEKLVEPAEGGEQRMLHAMEMGHCCHCWWKNHCHQHSHSCNPHLHQSYSSSKRTEMRNDPDSWRALNPYVL